MKTPKSLVDKLAAAAATPGVDLSLEGLTANKHATDIWDFPGPEVWVRDIESSIRGAGMECMRKLVAAADANGALLRLWCEDDGSGRWIAALESIGFRRDSAGGEIMERPPVGYEIKPSPRYRPRKP